MINKDSIVTAYDEHLTLVEWLQKVENALNNAVLTNLGIAKLSDKDNVATYQVTATFADNTTIASDSFTLPSTDIVTAFNSLATLVKGFDSRIATNTNNVNSILDIIDIAGEKIKADALKNSVNGDDDVIVEVDNDEGNEKLGIHLSPELQAKLARVLLTPSSAPTSRKVVTIATNGKQDNVDGTELTTLMSNIVDSQGHKRFIEDDITINSSAFNKEFAKWSLSGTHLMCRFVGSIVEEFKFRYGWFGFFGNLPKWIYDKIYGSPMSFDENTLIVDTKKVLIGDNDIPFALMKRLGTNNLALATGNTTELDSSFIGKRLVLQFDLLIDSE